jgi:Holliday junction resolvase RusA-like endonuclease
MLFEVSHRCPKIAHFRVETHPVPWERPRTFKGRRWFNTKRSDKCREAIQLAAKGQPTFDRCLLRLELEVIRARPKKFTSPIPLIGDLSNQIKQVEDALQKVLFEDDKRICEIIATKRYAEETEPEGYIIKIVELIKW